MAYNPYSHSPGSQCGQPHTVTWREPDDEPGEGLDRDARAVRYAAAKGAGRESMTPRTPGGHRNAAWGGALRRMTVGNVGPSQEDEQRFVSIPGRYVPVGFARYVSPVIDPTDYEYYRVAGWRVAVPRTIPGTRVRDLLHRIFYFGPQSAGYVRLGDTLVPAILETGDRMTLAQTAVEFEPYPLSP
jgi:hypothetical protein